MKFLSACGHVPTPLHDFRTTAALLGLKSVHIKDETQVLGQKAFKVRGAAWAIANLCRQKLNLNHFPTSLAELREALGILPQPLLFVAATDGNHGAAVAAMAQILGQKATIFMPAGASASRIEAITSTGANCTVLQANYDAAVAAARAFANRHGALLIQDTAEESFEQIPLWIMEGYATMADEIAIQMSCLPDYVFLQAGVGSFAASMIMAFLNLAAEMGSTPPRFISVEPDQADCIYRSIAAADGMAHNITGSLTTIMAGLACGRPSALAWPLLRNHLTAAFSCPDWIAETGIRFLLKPAGRDPVLMAGESAAPGMGLLLWLMTSGKKLATQLGIGTDSRVCLIATEGPTDLQSWYRLTGCA